MSTRRRFIPSSRFALMILCGVLASSSWTQELPAPRASAPATPFASYTAAQAAAGRTAYAAGCASCHGITLSGGVTAGPLNGNTFSQNWSGKPAQALFEFVQKRMPPSAPGSLSAPATAQLVAYLMQVNGAQASNTELAADSAALARVRVPRGPVSPTPSFMPLSPLVTPLPPLVVANPLDHFTPVSDELLRAPPPTEWLIWRRTYDDQGFSPLKSITKRNVSSLRVAWTWSLPNGPNESTPLEHDGVLFVHSYGDRVQALNALTGDLLWEYARVLPADARASVKRNLALYHERLLVPTSDDHEVALDVKTGTVIWDTPVADYTKGWQVTGGPLVAHGRVLQGIVGQTVGGGAIVGLDFETGQLLWRFNTIPRPGEPGGDSWNGVPPEKRSGGSVWTAGSYDPQLHLAFFGVGQTYDTGPLLHAINQPGITNDALFTDSTLALDPDTGKLAWHFQHVHNDQWDLDWAFEQQRIDLPVNGAVRKLVVTSGKMGIYEAMDAATGRYVFSQDMGIQNVVSSIDPATGEKSINPAVVVGDGKPHTICPHPGGGRNWIAGSYNASTHMVYVAMNETCMDLIPAPPGQRGNLSSGVNWSIRAPPGSDGKFGRVAAANLETHKIIWTQRQRAPQTTGVLATAGGVVFAGSLDRFLRAYDDTSGAPLWQVRLNDAPNSCPITFAVNGKQYLAIVVGSGGSMPQTYPVLVPEIHNPPEHGATIWVFELAQERAQP